MIITESSLQSSLSRWTERLRNPTVSSLTRDYPENAESSKRPIEAYQTLKLSSSVQAALKQLQNTDQGQPHSAFSILLAALAVLVARLTGDEDIAVGTGEASGHRFVIRTNIEARESFASFLQRVDKIFNDCLADVVPFDKLVSHIQQTTKSEKAPLLYKFALYHAPSAPSQEFLSSTSSASDLSIYLSNTGSATSSQLNGVSDATNSEKLELRAYYNQRLFSSNRIVTILSQLTQLVESASANPQEPIGAIDLLTGSQLSVLPDPTQSLHWSNFKGAIHDIFRENARKHPDKLCVVETASRSVPQRDFTYRQINEASNVLAHHLLQAGVQKGEVVMIYAYRGVDLVIAIMGTLMSGATFSVLDPQYPADRQYYLRLTSVLIIYLDVAKPKALVIIDKASQETGPLDSKVRDFIQDSLQLRTEIPGLRIQDDGTVLGGSLGGQDVLKLQVPMKADSPGVVVGPDSVPTLSFTSGSEGRPKGVQGRHFSLCYYFPFMSEEFRLSDKDRFTMLSGIAHDPIQRDIFTPLFLGAQLLVPSREDIQHEKLAEWMKKYGATVTHLTPAMGQILVGGATADFPTLHHAFFVGDILIKRDCRLLQNLAPNVNIVNMYGTTEMNQTQRAVSYYEIPSWNSDSTYLDSMKDVIPAGKGMQDVQLLVVNRFDRSRLCSIGELGELYVRAGGLAEGYLDLPELNQTKFINNWFVNADKWVDEGEECSEKKYWKGVRDRLYRSGDLGRYTPFGDVECSGRADDQVKIRGFRIELGEIGSHLSQHPLIQEQLTLVRRDKDEEPTLVSYIVPDLKKWHSWRGKESMEVSGDWTMGGMLRRFRPLRDDVKEHLRSKLPAYAVPTVILPLRRMPLNPNGKIDKPALPFPETSELLEATPRRPSTSSSALSETELALAQIWAELIRTIVAKGIRPEDSFFDLGGHSLTAQQMAVAIKRRWRGIELSMSFVFRNPTLKRLSSEIDRLRNPDMADDTENGQNGTGDQLQNCVARDGQPEYARDAKQLMEKLPRSFPNHVGLDFSRQLTVFLTGATGFLGAYLLRDLLRRESPSLTVIAHVRAKTPEAAFERVKQTCQAYGIWSPTWSDRIECVVGNLGDPKLGLEPGIWDRLCNNIDVVIHNGAWVHWVWPYANLKPANVQGTIDVIELCAEGKSKQLAFVSSTSVLDTEHYVELSDMILRAGGKGVSEADDLEGSSSGLETGYGQSKWVSEALVRECGRRGLRGAIEDLIAGIVTNTDDFLIRMIKGCVQLSKRPDISNTVNMVPVDHVAHAVVASAFFPSNSSLSVAQITSHPRLRFNEFLGTLETYGYDVPKVDYIPWKSSLEKYVASGGKDQEKIHALMPLYHFVTADLPSSTKAPELDDSNTCASLLADAKWSGIDASAGSGVTEELMGIYLAYLVAMEFLPPPPEGGKGKSLPRIELEEGQQQGKVGGRGGAV
ncbi:MAG: large subunit of alpha-aminoadipate reductase [Candelina submexicana]|nr:MAG: large subunit of alpha-aminoadipate reductase [Candelina submexicana]